MWFKKRNALEKELNCSDLGEIKPVFHLETGNYTITSCQRCNSAAHVVKFNDGPRKLACPLCLQLFRADPEEEWLKKNLTL